MNDSWYIEINGQLFGPYLTLQILQMVQNNQLAVQSLIKSAQNGGYYKVQDVIATVSPSIPSNPFPPSPAVQPQFQPGSVPAPQVQPLQGAAVMPSFPGAAPMPQMMPQTPGVPVQPAAPFGNPMGGGVPVSVSPIPNTSIPGVASAQEAAPPLVKPIGMEDSTPTTPEKSAGLGSTMRDWIDRGNVENGDIVCPHCWGRCSLETILFISSHPELMGDPLLGNDAPTRFLPKYFTAKGTAFDERGMECSDMACPHCHLKIPNAVIDLPSSFFSIVGAPASGKSYFLTAMVWQLRKYLPEYFNFSLYDTDPAFNMVLNNYERILFLNSNQQEYVSLPKTELQGKDFSNQIVIENNHIDLPRPFVFTLYPLTTHPYYEKHKDDLERSVVLYDNAGEHFETGRDSIANLATVHLVHSDGIIFLYDPLKDIRLRSGCSADDPQISKNAANVTNQMTIFTEMVARIHKYSNLRANEKIDKPLIMVIPKYDAWRDSFPLDIEKLKLVTYDQEMPFLDMDVVCTVSFCLRKYLLRVAPEIVGLAEGFSERVYFIPVSALGRIPEFDDEKSMIGIKPDHLSPIWAEVPFLLQLHLNKLLQAVCCANDSIPCVSKYKFVRGYIVFAFPETEERYTLPSFYCGKTIYCDTTQKYYRLPDYPEEIVEEYPADNEDKMPDGDDFWTK